MCHFSVYAIRRSLLQTHVAFLGVIFQDMSIIYLSLLYNNNKPPPHTTSDCLYSNNNIPYTPSIYLFQNNGHVHVHAHVHVNIEALFFICLYDNKKPPRISSICLIAVILWLRKSSLLILSFIMEGIKDYLVQEWSMIPPNAFLFFPQGEEVRSGSD